MLPLLCSVLARGTLSTCTPLLGVLFAKWMVLVIEYVTDLAKGCLFNELFDVGDTVDIECFRSVDTNDSEHSILKGLHLVLK